MAVNKMKIMEKCLEEVGKKFPDSVVGRYSDIGKKLDVHSISTGSISADWALGGGFSRMSMIFGFPSTGKTTLALTACAKMQKEKPDANIIYCDAEFALDPSYAAALGVDMEKMIIIQPESAEEGYNIIEMMLKSGVADLVVIDSIPAMAPSAYIENEIGAEVQIGAMARLTTQAVSRINRLSKLHDCFIIFINQYKEVTKINQFATVGGQVSGTTKYLPGGPQQQFYMTHMVEIRRSGQIKNGTEILSNVTALKVLKNKIAPPYREAEFCITFGHGLDKVQELVGLGLAQKVIVQAGSFYTIPDICTERLKGRVGLGTYLEKNPEVCLKLEEILKAKLNDLKDNGTNNRVQLNKDVDPVVEDKEEPETPNLLDDGEASGKGEGGSDLTA